MKIKKRNGSFEKLSFDKIIYRLKKIQNDKVLGKLTTIDPDLIAQKVVSSIYDGVSSTELDEEAARISISMTENLEFGKLASRIVISNLHKNTTECFSDVMEMLYENKDTHGKHSPVLADDIIELIRKHKNVLNYAIDYNRDYIFDYFGFKTLEKSYLLKLNGKIVERPQHLYMRVAIQVHKDDLENVIKTYNLISKHYFTFASPTYFNSGTRQNNLSSCFHEDTIVATVNKGPIKIKDVEIDDLVITHLGNVKKVKQLHKNLLNDRKLYELNISKTVPIKVTDNHKVWTVSSLHKINEEKPRKERVRYNLDFVKNVLNEKGAKLLSTEYKNIKTKLRVECVCKNTAIVSFESIYYHNILCNDKVCIYNRNKFKSKNLNEPEWKSVEDLQYGDYVGIPNKIQNIDYIKKLDILAFKSLIENKNNRNSNYTVNLDNDNNTKIILKTHWEHNGWSHVETPVKCSREHSSINRFWKIDSSFAKFLGIFYGDGHIMSGKDTHGNLVLRGIGITIHNVNTNLIEYCKVIGEKIFGIKPSIHTMKTQNIVQILYNSVFVGEVFNELFGRHFNNKKMWNEIYKWDKNMVTSLLEGLITTDGCISKSHLLSFQMSNVKFMRSLYYLLRNNNIDTSYGKERLQKNGTENHVQINIPISEIQKLNVNKYYNDDRMYVDYKPKCKNQYSPIEVDGFKFLKFENKVEIKEDLPQYVYTLGVEDDHSYNIGGIICVNCFLLGTADSVGGIFKTMSDVAHISKVGGGIGLHINNIRSKGSVIRGTNGVSDGIIPMLKVYNSVSVYINQCFTPDTWVYSKNGPVQMKDITTNDHLITIDGTFKKVNEVIKNNVNKEIMEIRATNTLFPVKVTKEHELYLLKNQKKITNYSVIKNRLEKGIIKPDFYNAGELTEDDLVGFPIPTYELDNDINDLDYYKFYGIMLGDGHVCNGRNEYGVTLGNEFKSDLKVFVRKYLDKMNIHYWECNNETECSNIRWSGNTSLQLSRDMLYDSDNQKIIKNEFLHLPKNKIMKILEGLLRTDGSNLKELAFTSSSQKLVMQMRYLLLRIGVLTSGNVKDNIGKSHVTKHGRTITTKQLSYYLRIPKHPNLSSIIKFKKDGQYFKYFEWNGMLWGRIRSINKIQYQGEVYDFNMIDNHNYLTDMGLVHNSGKRKGSFAIYLSPEHPDIFEFLDLRKNQGAEEMRARDLFLAMWIPDLFMQKVEEDADWYLMDPDECPGLNDVYGAEYEALYNRYIEEKRYRKIVKAQEIWLRILESQIETGTPYILYKDQANKKSSQKNIGTIKSSNLCVAPETMILTSKGYYPICTLENQKIEIWNGNEFTETTVVKTGENQPLVKIEFSNGNHIQCTGYHKFYINKKSYFKEIRAKDLKKHMEIIPYKLPIIEKGECNVDYSLVPVNCNLDIKLKWLSEFLMYNDKVCYFKNFIHISLHKEFLKNIQYLLQTLGIFSNINHFDEESILVVNFDKLKTTGINVDLQKLQKYDTNLNKYNILYTDEITVSNVSYHNRKSDTFCFKEEKRGMGVFNGILTGNCAEVLLYSDEKEYAVCFTGDTQILTKEGYRRIDECDNKEVLSYFNNDKEFKEKQQFTKAKLIDNGIKDVYELKCNSTKSIKATNEHLFAVLDKRNKNTKINTYKWKKLKDLTVDDKIVLPKTQILPNYNVNDEDESKEYTKLKSIQYVGKERVYDLNVPETHNFVAEGFVVHNCNLMSVALPKFVEIDEHGVPFYNHNLLFEVVKHAVLPMNNIIDYNHYCVPETKKSNFKHRPIGIGVQGLSDVYIKMRYPFESENAKKLNKEIFETMYYASLTGSMELAKRDGPYETFKGSPFSEGKFQFDMWAETNNIDLKDYLSGRWDWETLRKDIKEFGVRNSTLTMCQPTASSAQIMGNTESFEGFDSCIFKRRVLSGEYTVANKHLVEDLTKLDLWNKELKETIIAHNGSVQNIDIIPDNIKELYKTIWEISMKGFIDQSAERGPFVDMTQSLNLFVQAPTIKKLNNMHFYGFRKGLKTGIYYLRSQSQSGSTKFSIDPELEKKIRDKQSKGKNLTKKEEKLICSIDNKEECMACQ